jgi:hypothetical protein
VPSINETVRLKPQARTILLHLEKHGSISPQVAQNTYGVWRLAASVNELRKAGFPIETELRADDVGQKYARYFLKVPALAN